MKTAITEQLRLLPPVLPDLWGYLAITLAAGSGGADAATGRGVSAFQREASNVAVECFRRWCGAGDLLKGSSVAAGGNKPAAASVLGNGLVWALWCRWSCAASGHLALWTWGEPEEPSAPSCCYR